MQSKADHSNRPISIPLRASEEELHVLGCELFHGNLVVVDGTIDHVGLFLLQHDHPTLDRVFDAKTRNHTGTFLSDTVTAIGRLPLGCWVPPSVMNLLA